MRCNVGLLSPARLDLCGRGAALETGPSTRAEGDGVQVEAEVEMRGRAPVGGAEVVTQPTDSEEEVVVGRGGAVEFETAERVGSCGGGAGGGSVGGGGRLEVIDKVEVAEPSREREWVNPRLAVPSVPE